MAGPDRAINFPLRVQGIGDVERDFKRMGNAGEKGFGQVAKSANGAAREVSEYHARLKRVAAAARADVQNLPDMWKGDALDASRSRNAFVLDRINAEKGRIRSGLPDLTLPGAAEGAAAADGLAGALDGLGGKAGIAALALSALTVGVTLSIDAYDQHERALDKFNATLSFSGNLSGATAAQMVEMADRIAGATNQTEEALQGAAAGLAKVPGITAQALEEALTASARFADAMGTDVADTAETTGEVLTALAENDIKGLVKAMEGLNPVIAANILSLAEAGKTAEAQKAYFNALADAAGDGPNGVARNADRMAKSWENVKRSFGEAFAGPVTSGLDAIAGAIDFVSVRASGLLRILGSIGGANTLAGLQGAQDVLGAGGKPVGGGGNRVGSLAASALGMFSSVQARLYRNRADAILNPDKPDRPRRGGGGGGGGKSDAEREAERLAREAEAARKAADRVREANDEVIASYRLRAEEAAERLGLEGAALDAVERRQEIEATVRRLSTDLIEKEVAARKAEAAAAKTSFDETAARTDATAALEKQTAALREHATALYDDEKAQADQIEQLERAAALYEATRTPIEMIRREVASLTDLLRAEAITPDIFNRRMNQLAEDMVDAARRGRDAWRGLGDEVSGSLKDIIFNGGDAMDVLRELIGIAASRMFDKNIGDPLSDVIDGLTGNNRDKNIATARAGLPAAADVAAGAVTHLGQNVDLVREPIAMLGNASAVTARFVESFGLSVQATMARMNAAALAAPTGQLAAGNIDLHNRPIVRNEDGSISTVRSMSFGTDEGEVLVPTVRNDGKMMSDDEAMDEYFRTGKHLGIFDTPENATRYAEQLHNAQEQEYGQRVQGLTQSAAALEDAFLNLLPMTGQFGSVLAQALAALSGGGGGGGMSGFLGLALNLGASALAGGSSVGITNGGAAIKALGKTPGFAGGGDPPIGMPFDVGENGRERMILLPGGGARVFSNEQTRRMANDNHAPAPINNYFSIPERADPRRTATTVSRAVQGGIQRASSKGLAAGPRRAGR